MERVVALTLLAIALTPLHAAPQHPKSVAKKPATAASSRKVAVATRSAVHTSPTALHLAANARSARASSVRTRGRSIRGRRLAHAAPVPSYQLHPDPERYQTIQKALADRGYFKGDPNGTWGDDSTDAMRRFQADQKIDNDGKIDALSLISLKLGPKHDGTTAAEPKLPSASDGASSAPLIQPSGPDTLGGQPR